MDDTSYITQASRLPQIPSLLLNSPPSPGRSLSRVSFMQIEQIE